MNEQLEEVLRPVLGEGVAVDEVHVLTGGASRTTYAFEAVSGAERRRLILRTGPAADHYAGMELEAAAQAAAAAAGAPVPHVLAASDSPVPLGNPFLICDEVAGETIVRRIQRALHDPGDRRRLLRQCARALAAIHSAGTDVAGLVEQDQLTVWRDRLDEIGDTTATFEFAFRWLADNRPTTSPPCLVHGDFRMGNLIVDGSTLAAVLDWELVHIGEVYEDLAWFCVRAWRFGAPADMAAGGLGGIEEFVNAYEEAGGAVVDRDTLHWWLVLSTLKWGVICRAQAERHLSGETRSVELATIGRRVCENEWDLLDLLTQSGDEAEVAEVEEDRPAHPFTAVYGRPTAAELVCAVAEFLDGEVRANTTGAVNFRALVAANALRIVERELLDHSGDEPRDALHALGYPDEDSLAHTIRAGDLSGRDTAVLSCLRGVVGHRVEIAHPGYREGR